MWKMFKQFFSLTALKGRRKLKELESIKDKTFRIQETLEQSSEDMRKHLIETKTEYGIAKSKTKEIKASLVETENALLSAVEQNLPEEDQGTLVEEVEILEVEVQELEIRENFLASMVTDAEERRANLEQDIRKSKRILRTTEAQYKTAQTFLKANAGVLPESVFKEIEELRQESIRLQQKGIATAEVSTSDRKKDINTIVRKVGSSSLNAKERAKQIKEKRTKGE